MKIHHRPYHWIAVAIALAALLLTLNEAHGQTNGTGVAAANTGIRAPEDVKPSRDQSVAKEQRSVKKAKRAVKRTVTRGRHGNSEIDS